MTRKVALLLGVVAALVVKPPHARALDAEAFGQVRAFHERVPEAFLATRLTREPTPVPGAIERWSGQLFAVGRTWDQPMPGLVWQLGLDTGLIEVSGAGAFGDGRDLGRHAAETLFIGETFIDVQPYRDGRLVLRAGKLRPRFGRGAIFDAYAFGALADLDLRYTEGAPPVAFRAWAGLPSGRFNDELKSSPLFNARATIEPKRGLELSLLGALFLDRDDALAPTVSRALIRRTSSLWDGPSAVGDVVFDRLATTIDERTGTRGTVGWLGGDVEWHRGRWRVQLTGLAALGTVETALDADGAEADLARLRSALDLIAVTRIADPAARRERLIANAEGVRQLQSGLEQGIDGVRRDLVAGFVLLEAAAPVLQAVDLESFFIWSSGEDGAAFLDSSDRLSSFPSVAPLLPLTDIFFGGSTAPSQQTPSFSSLAPDGSGVLGAGLGPRAALGPFDLSALVAVLWSDVPPPDRDGDRFYGVEVDASVTWFFGRHFQAFVRGAYLATGDYFGDAPPAVQVFGGLGLDASTVRGLWD